MVEEEKKIHYLWKPIEFSKNWVDTDTSILDDINDSWFQRRKVLQENSKDYENFLNELKREHAIETGIVEKMYDLSKGITETFIKEGFVQSYLSHGDTNVPESDLMAHLKDHLEAVDFVFDVVKNNRDLTTSFIKQLHQLVTRNQQYAEGRNQFGQKTKIELKKGVYKVRENNPSREDGTVVMYCHPDHVASEMDNLIAMYNDAVQKDTHPLILAAWVHHAFTTIHPFQDGNGRVARLLASLIFIKFGYFPFTVLREEAKVKYIKALEQADADSPQALVDYFAAVQKKNIQKALNIKEVSSTSASFSEIENILVEKIKTLKEKTKKEHQDMLKLSRKEVFNFCNQTINKIAKNLQKKLYGAAKIKIRSCSFSNHRKHESGTKLQNFFYKQIVKYATSQDYYFNRTLPKAWLTFTVELSKNKSYQLGITIHHYGYDDSALAIGAFLEYKGSGFDEKDSTILPLDIPPHVISISGNNIEKKKKNIHSYLENTLTIVMAQIASEI